MKFPIFLPALLLALCFSLSAEEEGRFLAVRGKVEIQEPGKSWEPAAVGSLVRPGSIVSTGFQAGAVIKLGNAEIEINSLTRLAVEELMRRKDVLKTNVNLRVGKIRVDVKADPSLKSDFTVKSPVSTAAVRGTKFSFDGSNLEVENGVVALGNKLGWVRRYDGGQSGRVSQAGRLEPSATVLEEATSPAPTPGAAPVSGTPRDTAAPPEVISGNSRLTILW